jgi:hypothetical protein
MFINIKDCKTCDSVKLLMGHVILPHAVIDNINQYFQCLECDYAHKRQVKKEKQRIYYRENKDKIIERTHCNSVKKIALNQTPINTFVLGEMNKRLKLLKENKTLDLYWSEVNYFMIHYHQRYSWI